MNKTLKYALGVVLTAGVIAPAFAQDNFPDVPDNHWAYEALARMKKDGLLVGYPDGLFRGNRPASRYELAVAVHATYTHLKNITDGLQAQIDELKKGNNGADLQALRDALTQLQNDVNNMKGWGADIDNLKKMAATFEKELASMGVDIEGLKKDLADLAKRVGVLEAHRLPIDVHGDASLLMMAGGSSSHRPGITVDGRPVGVSDTVFAGNTFVPVGMSQDLSVYHEAALRISGNNETGPKWHATMVTGNLLGGKGFGGFGAGAFNGSGAFPSQSQTAVATPFSEGGESVYFQDFAVSFDTSIVGQGFSAELGRTGYSIDPYIYQRPDVTPYFQNDRWDNGKWMMDGGIFGFHWGGAKLDVFGGRIGQQSTTGGIALQPMLAGAIGHRYTPGGPRPTGLNDIGGGAAGVSANNLQVPVSQNLGLNLAVPLGQNGKLDLAYIWLESNSGVSATGANPDFTATPRVANRVQVFGGDLKWNFGNIVFDGGYSQSNVQNGKANVVNRDNWAWHAQAAYDASRWGAQIGYREIQPQFGAPGDWGRIGMWWNPTDIRGPEASIHLNLSDQLKLTATGEWYNGVGKNFGAGGIGSAVGLATNDRINRYTAELGYRLNDAWNLSLGAEFVDWDLKTRAVGDVGGPFAGGKPRERWYNIGLGYNLSDMARLNFLWQISDYDAKGTPGFAPFGNGQDRATGNLLTTQLTIKF
jgi:hypothetical protein